MIKKSIILIGVFIAFFITAHAQVVLNEVASSNVQLIADEDGDYPDWIELLNTGATDVNLASWSLTDDNTWNKWLLPDLNLNAGQRLLIFASGKNRNAYNPDTNTSTNHWETALNENSFWEYFVGNNSPQSDWTTDLVNASGWTIAPGGFGYGDNDDTTILPDGTTSVYSRQIFTVADLAALTEAILSIDYDDAFIAYLNGVEIARNGISGAPNFNDYAEIDHEATMYSGGNPEQFLLTLSQLESILVVGLNVLAIEVHNISNTSSDLTSRAWLHFGIANTGSFFNTNPAWFVEPIPGNNGQNLHTNFKIGLNETIKLFNAAGEEQDNALVNTQAGHSKARIPDGEVWCYTDTPSPGLINSGTCYSGYASAPNILPVSGYYSGNVSVSISGGPARYTLNGSIPDNTNPLYINPLALSSTSVVRARKFEPGKLPSAIVSRTYFINEPTTLPVVSIIAHPGDLFSDGTGGPAVYENAAGFQQSETTGCTIQYFDAAHEFQFESPASLTPVGNFSLDFAQKSMQFKYDEEYGATGDIAYNIFSKDKPGLGPSHGFRVRNTDDDWSGTRMRDLIVNRMALSTHCGTAAYQNVAVFINGEYWGHYGAREMLNDDFMHDNYGAVTDHVDMVKTAFPAMDYVAEEGTTDDFFEMSDYIIDADVADDINFSEAENLVDIKNWVDYFAAEIYVNNQDWFPSSYFNNTRLGNADEENIKWKYILWDVGYSQGVGGGFYDDLLSNTLSYPSVDNRHTDMMSSLLENDSLYPYFINRFADLLNWHWTTEKIHEIIDDCVAEIAPEIDRQNNAWGSGGLETWLINVDYLKSFHEIRPQVQRNQIEEYFGLDGQVDITLNVLPIGAGHIKISTVIPDVYPWSGIYFNGNPVAVTAIASPGFTFDHWSPNAFIASVNNASFSNNFTSNTTFTAHFIGIPTTTSVFISEVNYHSDDSRDAGDWIEIYNPTTSVLDISDWVFSGENFYESYVIPTSTILQSGDRVVLAQNLLKFSSEFPEVMNVIGPFEFDLNNNGEHISFADLNDNPVISFTYDDSPSWPCTADGHGRTLERVSPEIDPSSPAAWFDGCMGGSPGTVHSSCNEVPIIDEINYKSSPTENAGDWIEFYNNSLNEIEMSFWTLGDANGNEFVIPDETNLTPGGHLVFYQDEVLFNTQFPAVTNTIGPTAIGMSCASTAKRPRR